VPDLALTTPLAALDLPQKPADWSGMLALTDLGRVGFAQAMARKGNAADFAAALGLPWAPGRAAMTPHGLGIPLSPGEWALLLDDPAHLAQLQLRTADLGYLSDQTHGRVGIRIEGAQARDLLAKGISLDLHPAQAPEGFAAQTQLAGIGVLLHVAGPDTVDLYCFAGLQEALWGFLAHAAAPFGAAHFKDHRRP